MNITFLGATKTVTGSNFLVEGAGKKFLVDCGMFQGSTKDELKNAEPFLFDVNEIDFMLLTHAHIDHSGRIPKLYNEGYRKPIYATKATCDLCTIMLPDSGHIQEMEIEWKNRKRKREGKEALPPLYTAEEALKAMEVFKPVKYDEIIEIDPNIHVRFNDAGHMLGSSIIEVWINENGEEIKTVFTGDLGNNDIPLLSSPTMIERTDYLVMESTYGGRLHNRNEEKAQMFLKIVSETLENGGTVVIPSFAVGRTQEILYELNNLKENQDDEKFKKEYYVSFSDSKKLKRRLQDLFIKKLKSGYFVAVVIFFITLASFVNLKFDYLLKIEYHEKNIFTINMHTYTYKNAPQKVKAFYEKRCKAKGIEPKDSDIIEITDNTLNKLNKNK